MSSITATVLSACVAITFRQRSLALDPDLQRHRLSDWQGSAVVGLPSRNQVFLSLSTRQHLPADLRRVKLATGTVDRLSGIGGELRAGVERPGGKLWVLALYRLHELSLEPLELLHTYRVPKYGWDLLSILDGTRLALTRLNQKRVPIFSLRTRSIEKSLPMVFPQLAVDGPRETTLFSFWDEHARSFDEQLVPRGRARPLPIGLTPLSSPGAIHFVQGERRIANNVHPPDPRITWVYSLERLAVFAPTSWEVLGQGPRITGLQSLIGFDATGQLIGRSDDEIVLMDAGRLTEVARHRCGVRITVAAQAAPSAVAFRTGSRQGDALQLVEWTDAASSS